MNGKTFTRKMDAAYFQQLRHSQMLNTIHHRKLIETGHEYDGMDGYQSPPGFTKADGERLWIASIDEAKAAVVEGLV